MEHLFALKSKDEEKRDDKKTAKKLEISTWMIKRVLKKLEISTWMIKRQLQSLR